MNGQLIVAMLIALASGSTLAATKLTIPNVSDAFIEVTNQSVFESVLQVTPTEQDSLLMSFSATYGKFSDVSYTFYTDSSLKTTVTGDDWSTYTLTDSPSFTSANPLYPFEASSLSPHITLTKSTPYFVKLSGMLDSHSGELKITVANAVVTAVPEPESYAMLLAGLGLMGAIARRRGKAKAV